MSKYINAEKLLSEIDRLNSLVSYESEDRHDDGLHDAYKAVKNIVTSLQQEQLQVADASKMEPEGIEAVVHHCANVHYVVTNIEQLNARLKQFDEGAKVLVYIEARKEE